MTTAIQVKAPSRPKQGMVWQNPTTGERRRWWNQRWCRYRCHKPRNWTEPELALLAEHFPKGGVRAVQRAGVTRPAQAIQQKAWKLGIASPGQGRSVPVRQPKVDGERLERAIELYLAGRSFASIARDLEAKAQAVENAVFIELAKRNGTAVERDIMGVLTPNGSATLRRAMTAGMTGREIREHYGISAALLSHERRRWRKESDEVPPLGGGRRYAGAKLSGEDRARVLRIARFEPNLTEIARQTGVSRHSIDRIRKKRQDQALQIAAAEAIAAFARALRGQWLARQRRHAGPMSFEEQLARVQAGARLVTIHPIRRPEALFTHGGVVGEINL
jgi:hypothetical protein